jgi:hypothetical protein
VVICNLHGGLGNQLFQAFYVSLCLKEKSQKVIFLTGSLGQYNVKRELEINNLILKTFENSLIKKDHLFLTKIRIPKILCKLNILKSGIIHFWGITLIDDYCADLNLYSNVPKFILFNSLNKFRQYFFSVQDSSRVNNIDTIYHLRLTDYFKSTQLEVLEIKYFLNNFYSGNKIFLITDNENLLSKCLTDFNVNYEIVSTLNFSSLELFCLFSTYLNIFTNKSTLSLWSSIIYDRTLISSNSNFCNFKKLFNETDE